MRERWTDDRLDDLAQEMRSGFERVDRDLRDLRVEMRSQIGGVRSEIGALRSMMFRFAISLIACFAGLIAAIGVSGVS